MKLEKKLLEEVARFNEINKYARKLMKEQELPAETGVLPADAGGLPPETPPPTGVEVTPPDISNTEEIDITDLVNMTKSIKTDIEDTKGENKGVISKMDDVFTKLNDLESKLNSMDSIISKIDELGSKIEQVKEPTPQERLQMRSLDSYPFNQNPQEFFKQKQGEMRSSGKNEYILTKNDIENYSQETIKDTFNKQDYDDQFKF
jgi:hypothetical protein